MGLCITIFLHRKPYRIHARQVLHTKNNMMTDLSMEQHELPSGVDLTLNELQEMATRQQQQIEAQQQMLVAKEQRLKFLKQQELRHQQIASENERLRKLREKVEAQELKLKKLRALRGQVNENRGNNNNLTAELETIKALFNEKEKELSVAVNKVDELTRQLEVIRQGKVNGINNMEDKNVINNAAMQELEKLRKELMLRNKLNEQQNSKLAAHREILHQRKEEMSNMDQRIAELQARLRKKRSQRSDNILNLANQTRAPPTAINKFGGRPLSANIAAVEPYMKYQPKDQNQEDIDRFALSKQDPKYQTLPYNIKFPNSDGDKKPDVNSNVYMPEKIEMPISSGKGDPSTNGGMKPSSDMIPKDTLQNKSDFKPSKGHTIAYETVEETLKNNDQSNNPISGSKAFFGAGYKPPSSLSNFTARPFGSTYSTSMLANRSNMITTTANTTASPPAGSISSPGASLPKTSTPISGNTPVSNNKSEAMREIFITGAPTVSQPSRPMYSTATSSSSSSYQPLSVVTSSTPSVIAAHSPTRPGVDSRGVSGGPQYHIASSRPQPPMQPQRTQDPPSPASSSNSSNSTSTSQHSSNNSRQTSLTNHSQSANNFGKSSSLSQSGAQFDIAKSTRVSLPEQEVSSSKSMDTRPNNNENSNQTSLADKLSMISSSSVVGKPSSSVNKSKSETGEAKDKHDLSPTSVNSALSVLMAGTGTQNVTKPSYRYAPKSVIANTYMSRLGTGALDQYRKNMSSLYKDFITNQTVGDDKPAGSGSEGNTGQGDENGEPDSPNKNIPPPYRGAPAYDLDAERLHYRPNVPKLRRRLSSGESDDLGRFHQRQHSQDENVFNEQNQKSPTSPPELIPADNIQDSYNNNSSDTKNLQSDKSQSDSRKDTSKDSKVPLPLRAKKTNLKQKNSNRPSRRVSFDPLALLLDASLEGELDLVMRTAQEVHDPSQANDEGITALHNAICAGHFEIVKFLVEFGCNVNSPDSDGWTPLHCAASCNNLPMVRLLVEHGACIFATTISDHETAAEKCEEDEDGYDGCSEYLYSVQEKLGIINGGVVFSVFEYKAQNSDELSFHNGNSITVLRKGDENEKDWWWARLGDREGYIPRNLLGLYPRKKLQSKVEQTNRNKDS